MGKRSIKASNGQIRDGKFIAALREHAAAEQELRAARERLSEARLAMTTAMRAGATDAGITSLEFQQLYTVRDCGKEVLAVEGKVADLRRTLEDLDSGLARVFLGY